MELKCISQETANLIMDALFLAWIEQNDYDLDRAAEGEEWTKDFFVRFCENADIHLIGK